MKLYSANLISTYIEGSRCTSLLSIKESVTSIKEVAKVQLQYWLVTDIGGILTNPYYCIHCTIEIRWDKVVNSKLKSRVGDYQNVGTIKLGRMYDVAQLIGGSSNVTAEDQFKHFSNGYYGDDIINAFGDFTLCNQCIAHYIPNTMIALLSK